MTEHTPSNASSSDLYAAGLLAEKNGNRALARTLYERSLALESHFKTYERLGTLAAEDGNWQEAVNQYYRATETDPNQARPHFFLAQAYLELGETVKARTSAATAVRLNPQYGQAAALLASIADRHS